MTCRNDFTSGQEGAVLEYTELTNKLKSYQDLAHYQNNVVDRLDKQKVQWVTNFVNRIVQSPAVDLTPYPGIKSRVDNASVLGDINTVEVSNFIVSKGYTEDAIIGTVINVLPPLVGTHTGTTPYTVNDGVSDVLTNLNDFFDSNVAGATTGDFCSAFISNVAKLAAIYSLASAAVKKISELKNGVKSFLENFNANVKKLVDGVVERVKKEIDNHLKQLTRMKNLAEQIVKRGVAKANEIKEKFSTLKIEDLKNRLEETISKMAGQFEELTPEAIAYIMFRLCQMTTSVQEFLRNPIDNYKKFVREVQDVKNVIDNEYQKQQYNNYVNGGLNLDRDQVFDLRRTAYRNQSNGVGQDIRNGGITSSTPAVIAKHDNELMQEATTFNVTRSGRRFSVVENKYFRLTERTANVGVDYNSSFMYPDDCGWTSVRAEAWLKAAMLSERLGKQLTINSAYRTPEKNNSLSGSAKQSFHMRGMALDISTSGIDPAELIKQANLVGFKGIGFYNTFIHVDIRTYLAMWINGNPSDEARRNLNIHKFPETYGYFKDGYNPPVKTPTQEKVFNIADIEAAIARS